GCIAITLYKELIRLNVKCDITATDISDKALDIASLNAKELIGESDSFHLIQSDLFNALDNNKRYDMIVSNPPYIPTKDINELEDEVRKHDPLIALDGGEAGLDIYHRLIDESRQYIKVNGWLYMEIGYNQGEDITDIMKKNGYKDIRIYKDLAGLNRVICGSFS
nr:peptide chain release factor N(5)-glutamine methyltransferase [Lachnospiraceae bacterium]